MVGAKRRKVSKNKKKNWRKHSNINDVEEHLDDVRLQERTGGLVSEKKDSELFVIERKAPKQTETAAEIRARKKLPRQLKCQALLLPDPNVKPGAVPRKVKQLDPSKDKAIRKIQKRKATDNDHKTATGAVKIYDLWDDDVLKDKDSSAIDDIDEGHFSIVTKRRRVKVPSKFLEKTSQKPAVEAPHPGMSYNPTFEDHQELLQSAVEVEIAKERAEKKITRALDEKFPNQSRAQIDETYLKEMSAGLKDVESEGESEVEENNTMDQLPVIQPVRNIKKTQTQRNKEKRQKDLEAKKQRVKEENIKKNEFYRLKSIKKEVTAAEEISLQRQFKRSVRLKEKKEGTARLGHRRFDTPDLDLKLSDEIEGSLRLLKPEGCLLEDRYKSLQRRNMLEPRVRAKKFKIKFRPKRFEKKSHKAVTL